MLATCSNRRHASKPRAALQHTLASMLALLCMMATTQANAITVESGRTEISFLLFSGKASAERWTSAVYSPSVDVIAIDGHVYEPSKTDICQVASPPLAATSNVFFSVRRNCTLNQMMLAATSRGARALVVARYLNYDQEVDISLTLAEPQIPLAFTDSATSARLFQLLDDVTVSNISIKITPIEDANDGTDENRVSPYARTVVFVVMCIMILLVLSIYCQGHLQLFIHDDATRRAMFDERGLVEQQRQQQLVDQAIMAIPMSNYSVPKDGERDTCAVCLDDMIDDAPARVLHCKHVFHVPCIDPWLHTHHACPLCKRDILEQFLSDQASPEPEMELIDLDTPSIAQHPNHRAGEEQQQQEEEDVALGVLETRLAAEGGPQPDHGNDTDAVISIPPQEADDASGEDADVSTTRLESRQISERRIVNVIPPEEPRWSD